MKLSLVLPVFNESHRLPTALLDLQSFFARLPLDIELIIVCEPNEKASIEKMIQSLPESPRPLATTVIENQKRLGRGPSLQVGMNAATGDILGTLNADLSIPLSEIFAAVQEFLRDPDGTKFILGNRRSLKRPRHGPRSRMKKIFDDIEHDKAKALQLPDPTTPFWVIHRDLWKELSPGLRLRRWYYTPPLLQELRKQNAPIKSIDINCHDSSDTRFRWWHSVFA